VALYEGRLEDALALAPATGATATPEEALIAAHTLAALGRYAEAAARVPELATHWPASLGDDLLGLKARWRAEAGQACTLSEADAARLGKAKPLVLARCAFAAGDFDRAVGLLGEERSIEARALGVRSLHALHRGDEARAALRKLYLDAPEFGEMESLLSLLGTTVEALTLNVDERLARAERLIRAVQPERAIAELKALGKQTDRLVEVRRLHLLGEAEFKTRENYPDAARTFAKSAKLRGPTEAYDAFHAVRATARAGDNAGAIQGFAAFSKRYPKDELATDANYLAAWLSLREHRANAVALLTRFVKSDGAKRQRGLLRSGTWDLAWAYFSARKFSDAQAWFGRYAEIADGDLERARGHYWAARALGATKQLGAAESAYGRAIAADGLGYYALLSVRELRKLARPLPKAFPNAEKAPPEPRLVPPPDVQLYASMLLTDDAVRAAEPWLRGMTGARERARAAMFTADADRTFTQAAPLMDEALAEGPRATNWLWKALFPTPYARIVAEATARFELPPALFYGHMQVESRYRPAVVSGADAIGLMQLLPRTGERVGEPLGIRVTRTTLTLPATNITLGSAYLGSLVKRYGGQEPLAIAAYNAGTERVDEWIRRMGKVELARWVEEIPVEQTRNYVRRVISAWARYRAVDTPETPWDLVLHYDLSPPAKQGPSKRTPVPRVRRRS
jgi:soluble lytic murein transglycosylase